MKALGYIITFCFLYFVAGYIATNSSTYNIQLALFLGSLVPIIMALIANINGDLD